MLPLQNRFGSSNAVKQTPSRSDSELENEWKASPPNLWLYQLFVRMQEPQKNMHIYKNLTRKLVLLCEPYARHTLDISVMGEKKPINREEEISRWSQYRGNEESLRWYRDLLKVLRQWSPYNPLMILLNRDQVKTDILRLFRTIPSWVIEEANAENPLSPIQSPKVDFEETIDALRLLISSKEELKVISRLKGQDAQSFIDLLDTTMDQTEPYSRIHTQCLHTLRKVCGRAGTLPTACMLSDGLEKDGTEARTSGGFADVWLGKYKGRSVALKVLRIYGGDNIKKVKKSFCREAVLWKRLSHPNILPFLGASTTLFPLCMVCQWMTNGNIMQYLKKNPAVNRLDLLMDIAKGLQFLHSIGVLHGDLKGANILINDQWHACLSDFGLTAVTYDANTVNAITTSSTVLGSIRWMAPEMMHPELAGLERCQASAESDVYAFAMVLWEVFTGNVPFHQFPRDATVLFKVTLGIRPERPLQATIHGLSDMLWSMTEMCWQTDWQRRPRIPFVLQCLEEAVRQFVPPSDDHIVHTSTFDEHMDDTDSSDGGEEGSPYREDFTVPREPQDGILEHLLAFPTSPQLHNQFQQAGTNALDSVDLHTDLERLLLDRNPSHTPSTAVWDVASDDQDWFCEYVLKVTSNPVFGVIKCSALKGKT